MTHRQVSRIALNRHEVALSIGVSANSIDLMVKEGALPPPRKWHSRKLWLVSEIEAAIMEWPNGAPPQEDNDEEWRAEHIPSTPSTKPTRKRTADSEMSEADRIRERLFLESLVPAGRKKRKLPGS